MRTSALEWSLVRGAVASALWPFTELPPGLLSLSVDEGGRLLCGIDAFMGLALQLMAFLVDGDWSASFRVMGVGEGLEAL